MSGSPSTSPPIHCMQGRLLPPEGDRIQAFPAGAWPREFEYAQAAEIQGIEWIYEASGETENPLGTDAGIARLADLIARNRVVVESVVADWFMDQPLLEEPGTRLEKLRWLLGRAATARIRRIVLPFVDASAVGENDVDELARTLTAVVSDAAQAGVELHLETPLAPDPFALLLKRLDPAVFMANYDSGNSASLGYRPAEEFEAYGSRIGSVHIKDRLHGGGTVPLGEGDADLELVLSLLRRQRWNRPLVLQAARGRAGHEVETVRSGAKLVRAMWDRCGEMAWT